MEGGWNGGMWGPLSTFLRLKFFMDTLSIIFQSARRQVVKISGTLNRITSIVRSTLFFPTCSMCQLSETEIAACIFSSTFSKTPLASLLVPVLKQAEGLQRTDVNVSKSRQMVIPELLLERFL